MLLLCKLGFHKYYDWTWKKDGDYYHLIRRCKRMKLNADGRSAKSWCPKYQTLVIKDLNKL